MKVFGDLEINNNIFTDNTPSYIGMIIHTTKLDTMEKVIAIYGGTKWEKIENRFLIGAGNGYTINSTAGASSVTLNANNLPSHSHSIPARSSSATSYAHSAHSHSIAANHTHSGTFTLASNGAHTHQFGRIQNKIAAKVSSGGHNRPDTWGSTGLSAGYRTTDSGAHTHSVSLTATSTTMTLSADSTANHSHTFQISNGTSGANGSASPTSVSILNPYKAVYIWVRTE